MRSVAVALNVAATLAAACVVPLAAQAQDRAATLQVVRSAQDLQSRGSLQEALQLIDRSLPSCDVGDLGRPCRSQLGFARAYVTDREAERRPDASNDLMRAAARDYEAVLELSPGHAATIANLYLVYSRLGDTQGATALLQANADKDATGRTALTLGREREAANDLDGALAAYTIAAALRPGWQDPRAAIADLHRRLPPERLGELERLVRQWGELFPVASETALRTLIETKGPVADVMATWFPAWVTLVARSGTLSAARVDALKLDHPARRELVAYIAGAERGVFGGSWAWWMETNARRAVLAEAGLAVGKQLQAQGKLKAAVGCWESTLERTPNHGEFGVTGLYPLWARLDLERELAAAYLADRTLDPDAKRYSRVVEDLAQGKGNAYSARDLPAIQRYHTTLGYILAERGVWEGGGWRTATFQFRNALETAKLRRSAENVAYQPLPGIKAALAKNAPMAAALRGDAYLDAAEAYLDTDQFLEARAMLRDAAAAGATGPRKTGLDTLLTMRERLGSDKGATRALDARGAEVCGRGFDFDNALRDRSYEREFLERQRFKVAADLVAALDTDTNPTRETCARYALGLAATSLSSLVGAADLLRIERVHRVATRPMVVPASALDISTGAAPKDFRGKTWHVYLPTEGMQTEVRLSDDVIAANRANQAIARTCTGCDISIAADRDRVTVFQRGNKLDAKDLTDKVKDTIGRRSVQVVDAPAR